MKTFPIYRACPDSEGNWTQESDAETVSQIRIKIKGDWPGDFVKRICLDLEHLCLPLLVDVGGNPQESQMCILRQCTHSLVRLYQAAGVAWIAVYYPPGKKAIVMYSRVETHKPGE
jgi:CRISPR-associated protein Csx3